MRKTIILLAIMILSVSCNKEQGSKVIRSHANFEMLNGELLAKPQSIRELFILKNYIIWHNRSQSDNFLHVFNKEDGVKIYSTGIIGYGVKEYISPSIHRNIWNERLFIHDLMGNTQFYFDVDSLKGGGDGLIGLTKEDSDIRAKGYTIRLEDNLYVDYNTKKMNSLFPYKLYSDGIEKDFGEYILKNEKEHFYPTIIYNPVNKFLIMGSGPFNYLCCYKKDGDDFKLVWENRENYLYGKRDGYIVLDNSRNGMYGIALTKDFIVTIQRDYENDRTSETAVIKDLSLLPQTLFVYNYNGKLLKIIDYKTPLKNIAGDTKSNMIYAIYDYPDFKLGASLIE